MTENMKGALTDTQTQIVRLSYALSIIEYLHDSLSTYQNDSFLFIPKRKPLRLLVELEQRQFLIA
jgi:hypothetical protein